MAGPNGGARPGAGRKPRDEKFKQPIAKAEKKIADRLPWLLDKEFELAEGVYREQVMPDGITRYIYQEKPDHRAITYLIDRVMGKPTERKELSGDLTIDRAREMTIEEIDAELKRRGVL